MRKKALIYPFLFLLGLIFALPVSAQDLTSDDLPGIAAERLLYENQTQGFSVEYGNGVNLGDSFQDGTDYYTLIFPTPPDVPSTYRPGMVVSYDVPATPEPPVENPRYYGLQWEFINDMHDNGGVILPSGVTENHILSMPLQFTFTLKASDIPDDVKEQMSEDWGPSSSVNIFFHHYSLWKKHASGGESAYVDILTFLLGKGYEPESVFKVSGSPATGITVNFTAAFINKISPSFARIATGTGETFFGEFLVFYLDEDSTDERHLYANFLLGRKTEEAEEEPIPPSDDDLELYNDGSLSVNINNQVTAEEYTEIPSARLVYPTSGDFSRLDIDPITSSLFYGPSIAQVGFEVTDSSTLDGTHILPTNIVVALDPDDLAQVMLPDGTSLLNKIRVESRMSSLDEALWNNLRVWYKTSDGLVDMNFLDGVYSWISARGSLDSRIYIDIPLSLVNRAPISMGQEIKPALMGISYNIFKQAAGKFVLNAIYIAPPATVVSETPEEDFNAPITVSGDVPLNGRFYYRAGEVLPENVFTARNGVGEAVAFEPTLPPSMSFAMPSVHVDISYSKPEEGVYGMPLSYTLALSKSGIIEGMVAAGKTREYAEKIYSYFEGEVVKNGAQEAFAKYFSTVAYSGTDLVPIDDYMKKVTGNTSGNFFITFEYTVIDDSLYMGVPYIERDGILYLCDGEKNDKVTVKTTVGLVRDIPIPEEEGEKEALYVGPGVGVNYIPVIDTSELGLKSHSIVGVDSFNVKPSPEPGEEIKDVVASLSFEMTPDDMFASGTSVTPLEFAFTITREEILDLEDGKDIYKYLRKNWAEKSLASFLREIHIWKRVGAKDTDLVRMAKTSDLSKFFSLTGDPDSQVTVTFKMAYVSKMNAQPVTLGPGYFVTWTEDQPVEDTYFFGPPTVKDPLDDEEEEEEDPWDGPDDPVGSSSGHDNIGDILGILTLW